MMKKPNRISMSLFDDELKSLINASAKIFPITQNDIDTNNNPSGYEYGRVDNHIYRWSNGKWEYIVADDKDISWEEIKNKPTSYQPKEHTHSELHSHSNKTLLDTITESMINLWNTVVDKATKIYVDGMLATKSDTTHNHDLDYSKLNHVHDYSPSSHAHDDRYYTESEVDTKLLNKSDSVHNHDGAYYKKSEVDTKLGGKSDNTHTHDYSPTNHNHDLLYATKSTEGLVSNHEERLFNIENGYTEGHTHPNVPLLNSITQGIVGGWNSAVNHIYDLVKHITSDERTLWNTVSDKSDKNHAHNYAEPIHIHDDRYYTESEIDTKLSTKSNTDHTHTDKADKTYVDTELTKKANSTTLSGHTDNSTIHVTQTDKNNWNSKANLSDIPTSLPANGGNADTVGGYAPSAFAPSGYGLGVELSSLALHSATTGKALVTGMYYLSSAATDKPPGITDCALLVMSYSTQWVTQVAIDWRTNKMYSRVCTNGVWSAWRSLGSGITISTTKPTDGSMWYKIIG